MNNEAKLIEERKRAADVIRRFESGEPERLACAVESGELSAWGAMVQIYLLPAVATIDALCRLRVVESEIERNADGFGAAIIAEREVWIATMKGILADDSESGDDGFCRMRISEIVNKGSP